MVCMVGVVVKCCGLWWCCISGEVVMVIVGVMIGGVSLWCYDGGSVCGGGAGVVDAREEEKKAVAVEGGCWG